MNHAHRMRSTTVSLSALNRLAAPTPMIEVLMACVVETGMPNWAATKSTVAAVVSGALLMFCGAGFLHVYAGHLPNLYSLPWVPLLFLVVDELCQRALALSPWGYALSPAGDQPVAADEADA